MAHPHMYRRLPYSGISSLLLISIPFEPRHPGPVRASVMIFITARRVRITHMRIRARVLIRVRARTYELSSRGV